MHINEDYLRIGHRIHTYNDHYQPSQVRSHDRMILVFLRLNHIVEKIEKVPPQFYMALNQSTFYRIYNS